MIITNTDAWDRREFQEQIADNSDVSKIELEGSRRIPEYAEFMQDIFSGLYKYDPKLREKAEPADTQWMDDMYKEISALPEWKTLRARTKLDPFISATATAKFCEQFMDGLPKNENMGRIDASDIIMIPGSTSSSIVHHSKPKKKEPPKLDMSKIRQAARVACKEATKEADSTNQMMKAFGHGIGPGTKHISSPTAKRELANKLSNNNVLKKIAELAGRMRSTAFEKQRTKTKHGVDEIADIKTGDDLARLVPAEMVKLAHPLMKVDFKKKFLEKNLLQYKLRGKDKEAKGPVIVCVDESGSMKGERDVWAKAVSMVLLNIAQKQNRNYCLVHFDGKVNRIDKFEKKADITEILDSMSHFTGGGTSYEEPLNEAIQIIANEKNYNKADIIFITDDTCYIGDEFLELFNKAKKVSQFNVTTVLIGTSDATVCNKFSDKVVPISSVKSSDSALDAVFSI